MTELDQLARLAGIEAGYHDIWGTYFEIPPTTKVAILEALGLAAATPAACAESLAAFVARPWRRMVEPVTIVPAEAQPGAVALVVPRRLAGGSLSWTVVLEDGNGRTGRQPIAALPLLGEREVDGEPLERRRLVLSPNLPEGYHRLILTVDNGAPDDLLAPELTGETSLIVAPPRCWGPDDVAEGERLWGISCQLYALHSARNWGIGNYSDLAELAGRAAAAGADVIGLNPLHALFPIEPDQASPYSPASRIFLNALYIDPQAVPDFAESDVAQALVETPSFRERLAAARASELVDYPAVAGLVLPVLRALHRSFRVRHIAVGSARARAFDAFRAVGGRRLRNFATFYALQEHFAADDPEKLAWRNWPAAYHDPDAPAVAVFATEHPEQIEFHEYLQWLADQQLAEAAARGRAAGLRVGLYRDLAVGIGPDSAGAWTNPAAFVRSAGVGAPPDLLAPQGQSWGLCPFNPLTLREQAYTPFIAALRANMRHAGAVRIDHVMGLMHLFWVPAGLSAAHGAYLTYPFQDLIRVLALESRRQRCLVIGEDLGTVPDGFRPAVMAAGVLSYRVFQFERVGGGLFKRWSDYPEGALVTAGTHDLPTLAGFWTGRDLDWRRALHLYPTDRMRDEDAAARIADRRRLIDALIDAGLWPAEPKTTDVQRLALTRDLLIAVHRYLARTPSRLMMVQIEDAVGQIEQQNLPGTVSEHPNWRHRLLRPLDEIFADPDVQALLRAVAEDRSTSHRHAPAATEAPAVGRG